MDYKTALNEILFNTKYHFIRYKEIYSSYEGDKLSFVSYLYDCFESGYIDDIIRGYIESNMTPIESEDFDEAERIESDSALIGGLAQETANSRFKEKIFDELAKISQHVNSIYIKSVEGQQNDFATTTQQLLLIYYLEKADILSFDRTKLDDSKINRLFSLLINRGWDNIKKNWRDLNKETNHKRIFTELNLYSIKKAFEELNFNQLVELIDKDINKTNLS